MSTTPLARHGIDPAALLRAVEPVVHAHGAEVVDLEFKPEGGGWTLRVFVEKAGASVQALSTRDAAVSLELCADVSRDLSPALDAADLIAQAYRLEVSSPGVERPLRGERDFVRFKGHKAKVRRRTPNATPAASSPGGDEGRIVIGVIGDVVDGKVYLAEGARSHEVPLAAIESARLVFEFGHPSGGHAHHGTREQRKQDHRKH